MNAIKKIILSIPFFRHRAVKDFIRREDEGVKNTNLYNRMLAMKIAPMIAEEISCGRLGIEVLESKIYFTSLLKKLFGNKSLEFSSQIRIERAKLRAYPDTRIWLIHVPSGGEVGQVPILGFVSKGQSVSVYSLENSIGKTFAICQWEDKTHYNMGFVENKVQFVNKIASLI